MKGSDLKYLVFIGVIFLMSCFSSGNISQVDYTYLYDPEQKLITPQIKVFHHTKDSSKLFFRIHNRDVLYGRLRNDTSLTSRILMRYKLYDYAAKDKLIDSTTLAFSDKGNNDSPYYLEGNTTAYMPLGKIYKIRLHFRDEYKDLNTIYEFLFDKRANGNAEFYLLKQKNGILYNGIAYSEDPVTVIKSPLISETDFILDSVYHSFKMAPPPFIENVNGDELKFTSREQVNFQDSLEISEIANISRLSPLDSQLLRLHFFRFEEGFPYVNNVGQMIDPIRYISTTSEFKKVKNAVNQKKELDQFWLKIGKDENTAKALIREYYSRVEIANLSFSSYKEGWKTDRGIIFIVNGHPTYIHKDIHKEVWTYGEENNILSVKFTFKKIRTEESNNIFVLQRDEDFKSNWYRAVDDWRQGRVNS